MLRQTDQQQHPTATAKIKGDRREKKNSRHKHKHSHNTLKLIEMARRVGDLLISVSHAFRNAALSVSLSLSRFPSNLNHTQFLAHSVAQ